MKECWTRGLSIDLGARSLRVAHWDGTDILVVPQLRMPAFVGFTTAGKVLLGQDAKSAFLQRIGNAFSVGFLLTQLHEARDMDIEGQRPPTFVQVENIKGDTREFLVIELLALLLRRAREDAQIRLDLPEPHSALVLSVPARCGFVQRQAIKDAALLAGFSKVRLLRAPAGVILWRYYLQQSLGAVGEKPSQKEVALVIDFGAVHIDCALVRREDSRFETLFAYGVDSCAGEAVDHALAYFCLGRAGTGSQSEGFEQPTWKKRLTHTHWAKLAAACEKAKRTLSAVAKTVKIELQNCFDNHDGDLCVELNSGDVGLALIVSEVMDQIKHVFSELIDHVDARLHQVAADHRFVDIVLLSGEGAKIPCVKRCLVNAFERFPMEVPPIQDLSLPHQSNRLGKAAVDHANACGGAIQGAILGQKRGEGMEGAGNADSIMQRMLLIDCLPSALGVDTSSSKESPRTNWLISASSAVPKKVSTTAFANMRDPAGVVVNFRESCALGRDADTSLGALVVQAPPHVSALVRASGSGSRDVQAVLDIDVDPEAHFRAKCRLTPAIPRTSESNERTMRDSSPAPEPAGQDDGLQPLHHFVPRSDGLDAAEVARLASYMEEQNSANRCLHYGLRSPDVLPIRVKRHFGKAFRDKPEEGVATHSAPCVGPGSSAASDTLGSVGPRTFSRDALPEWPVDLAFDTLDSDPWGYVPSEVESVESDVEADDKASPLQSNLGRESKRGGKQACIDRLRQKLDEKRMDRWQSRGVCDDPPAGEPVLTTAVCAVCMCTEAEIGRPFPFVLARCGHKCLCKPCLRKMRASMTGKQRNKSKVPEIDCPLCRTRSKPVLCEQYDGTIFASKDG